MNYSGAHSAGVGGYHHYYSGMHGGGPVGPIAGVSSGSGFGSNLGATYQHSGGFLARSVSGSSSHYQGSSHHNSVFVSAQQPMQVNSVPVPVPAGLSSTTGSTSHIHSASTTPLTHLPTSSSNSGGGHSGVMYHHSHSQPSHPHHHHHHHHHLASSSVGLPGGGVVGLTSAASAVSSASGASLGGGGVLTLPGSSHSAPCIAAPLPSASTSASSNSPCNSGSLQTMVNKIMSVVNSTNRDAASAAAANNSASRWISDMRLDASSDPTEASFTSALAVALEHLVALSQSNPPAGKAAYTRFHAVSPPPISVTEYLKRLQQTFMCSPECFVLCLIYIDRLVKKHPSITVNALTIHRLVVTSLLLAAKFFDDRFYSNEYYARAGGIRLKELNELEVYFLSLINYSLNVSAQDYTQYRDHVLLAVSQQQKNKQQQQQQQQQQSQGTTANNGANVTNATNTTTTTDNTKSNNNNNNNNNNQTPSQSNHATVVNNQHNNNNNNTAISVVNSSNDNNSTNYNNNNTSSSNTTTANNNNNNNNQQQQQHQQSPCSNQNNINNNNNNNTNSNNSNVSISIDVKGHVQTQTPSTTLSGASSPSIAEAPTPSNSNQNNQNNNNEAMQYYNSQMNNAFQRQQQQMMNTSNSNNNNNNNNNNSHATASAPSVSPSSMQFQPQLQQQNAHAHAMRQTTPMSEHCSSSAAFSAYDGGEHFVSSRPASPHSGPSSKKPQAKKEKAMSGQSTGSTSSKDGIQPPGSPSSRRRMLLRDKLQSLHEVLPVMPSLSQSGQETNNNNVNNSNQNNNNNSNNNNNNNNDNNNNYSQNDDENGDEPIMVAIHHPSLE